MFRGCRRRCGGEGGGLFSARFKCARIYSTFFRSRMPTESESRARVLTRSSCLVAIRTGSPLGSRRKRGSPPRRIASLTTLGPIARAEKTGAISEGSFVFDDTRDSPNAKVCAHGPRVHTRAYTRADERMGGRASVGESLRTEFIPVTQFRPPRPREIVWVHLA